MDDFEIVNRDVVEDIEADQLLKIEDRKFVDCFATPAGKDVLQMLKDEFYDVKCDIAPPGYGQFLGRRDVIFYILQRMKGSEHE